MPRNYAKEYKTYHSKPGQIKRRDARNKARAIMVNAPDPAVKLSVALEVEAGKGGTWAQAH